MPTATILSELSKHTRAAVRSYWQTRSQQLEKQRKSGGADQGLRSAVTGGAQMNGFIELLTKLVIEAGIDRSNIHYKDSLELPGYFRPSKKWDFLVVVRNQLVAALEAKSQVGPSFGNNFNNRTEEAMGSALDLWTAFREQAFGSAVRPWTGYLFLLEDCASSTKPVGVKEPHFNVFPEFRDSSYAKRYELFCRRLVLEKHYDCSAFLMSSAEKGMKGDYSEPASDLTFQASRTHWSPAWRHSRVASNNYEAHRRGTADHRRRCNPPSACAGRRARSVLHSRRIRSSGRYLAPLLDSQTL